MFQTGAAVLADVNSTGYKIVLFLHIAVAVVAFAPAFMTFLLSRAAAAGDPGAGAVLAAGVQRLTFPAMAATGVLGFGLVGMSGKEYTFSQSWVSTAGVVWLALIAVTLLITRPAARALAAGSAEAGKKVMMGTGLTHALFVIAILLMVFKPGS